MTRFVLMFFCPFRSQRIPRWIVALAMAGVVTAKDTRLLAQDKGGIRPGPVAPAGAGILRHRYFRSWRATNFLDRSSAGSTISIPVRRSAGFPWTTTLERYRDLVGSRFLADASLS